MTRAEDEWTKRAIDSLALVPLVGRDQIQALVADICAHPNDGLPDLDADDLLGRARYLIDGRATVYYEIVTEEVIKIVRVAWRS